MEHENKHRDFGRFANANDCQHHKCCKQGHRKGKDPETAVTALREVNDHILIVRFGLQYRNLAFKALCFDQVIGLSFKMRVILACACKEDWDCWAVFFADFQSEGFLFVRLLEVRAHCLDSLKLRMQNTHLPEFDPASNPSCTSDIHTFFTFDRKMDCWRWKISVQFHSRGFIPTHRSEC